MDFIQAFLRHYKYAIPKADWDWVYVSDDNFPDLECYGEALDYFGIDNIVALVPKDFFDDLPEVFLSLLLVNRNCQIEGRSPGISDSFASLGCRNRPCS